MAIILVTGASGFIGRSLVPNLLAKGHKVLAVVRNKDSSIPEGCAVACVGNIGTDTDWTPYLADVDCIVHLASRAHVMDDSENSRELFHSINFLGTMTLAKQALEYNVRRFVYISSVGVMGNISNRPFTEIDDPVPVDEYAVSKLSSEKMLKTLFNESKAELVVIRPPLVYAVDAPGNIARIQTLVGKGIPLPFASISNRRSVVSLANVVDFITACIQHPKAAGQVFFVSDGVDLSTPEIISRSFKLKGKKLCFFPFPVVILRFFLGIIGRKKMASKLLDDFQISNEKARLMLNWNPKLDFGNECDFVRGTE